MRLATRVSAAVLALMTFQSGYGISSALSKALRLDDTNKTSDQIKQEIDGIYKSYKASKESDSKTAEQTTEEEKVATVLKDNELLVGGKVYDRTKVDEIKDEAEQKKVKEAIEKLDAVDKYISDTDLDKYISGLNSDKVAELWQLYQDNGLGVDSLNSKTFLEAIEKKAESGKNFEEKDIDQFSTVSTYENFAKSFPIKDYDDLKAGVDNYQALADAFYKTKAFTGDEAVAEHLEDDIARVNDENEQAMVALYDANIGNNDAVSDLGRLVRRHAGVFGSRQKNTTEDRLKTDLVAFLNAATNVAADANESRAENTGFWGSDDDLNALVKNIRQILTMTDAQIVAAENALNIGERQQNLITHINAVHNGGDVAGALVAFDQHEDAFVAAANSKKTYFMNRVFRVLHDSAVAARNAAVKKVVDEGFRNNNDYLGAIKDELDNKAQNELLDNGKIKADAYSGVVTAARAELARLIAAQMALDNPNANTLSNLTKEYCSIDGVTSDEFSADLIKALEGVKEHGSNPRAAQVPGLFAEVLKSGAVKSMKVADVTNAKLNEFVTNYVSRIRENVSAGTIKDNGTKETFVLEQIKDFAESKTVDKKAVVTSLNKIVDALSKINKDAAAVKKDEKSSSISADELVAAIQKLSAADRQKIADALNAK